MVYEKEINKIRSNLKDQQEENERLKKAMSPKKRTNESPRALKPSKPWYL